MLATALRAAGEALALTERDPLTAPERWLRTVHASFLAPPAAHALTLDTTVVRRGGTTAHVDVAVSTATTAAALSARALYVRRRASDDAWVDVPVPDVPGPSGWVRFGPDEALRGLLSLEMTFDVLEPVRDEWILADFHARVLGDGYVLMDCELWSAGRLVAVLRQTMMTRPLPTPGS
jgi:acyl-CoA thioesterase